MPKREINHILSLRRTEEEKIPLLVTPCPGLYYSTIAQDGIIYRLRIPGGIINHQQLLTIADIADNYGQKYINITNRANIQIREVHQEIDVSILARLQQLGLGSINYRVDHIRNIMTSPIAGIDSEEMINTLPFVEGWDNYITENSHLGELSAKFSICFDGKGAISLINQLNDITLLAEVVNDQIHFRLYLSSGEKRQPPQDTGIIFPVEKYLQVLGVLANTYLKNSDVSQERKPRLREVIHNIGLQEYLKCLHVLQLYYREITTSENLTLRQQKHLGIHRQKQPDLYYIGVVLPLGKLETWQLRVLINISQEYNDRLTNNFRLTPWQNLLITDIPGDKISEFNREITNLGLTTNPKNIKSHLVACTGRKGCNSAHTEANIDALMLAEYLENKTNLMIDCPINIHFSGCSKSCAQHTEGDITLIGVTLAESEETTVNEPSYQIYICGRLLYESVSCYKIPDLMTKMLEVYQNQRFSYDESFREFTLRYTTDQLNQLLVN